MFVHYQKIRNAFVAAVLTVLASVAAFFGLKGDDPPVAKKAIASPASFVENQDKASAEDRSALLFTNKLQQPVRQNRPQTASTTPRPVSGLKEASSVRRLANPTNQESRSKPKPLVNQQQEGSDSGANRSGWSPDRDKYLLAMKIAKSRADSSGKGKDVLGPASPWKLNLYDDDGDGQYDRAKLDKDRDDVDDEKWNFKNGQWEKQNGELVWNGQRWDSRNSSTPNSAKPSDVILARYRNAIRLADGRANPTGKGKDVLGESSPWKLNLYDDDKNGKWERAKLDRNRDDVDDEKWNFKNGRWEKEGGQMVWSSNRWIKASLVDTSPDPTIDPKLQRYRAAFKKLARGSAGNEKGKDILGPASPWKLNVYDDDKDGTWDRAKLDTNRDDVDDEKWNFKKGRWEKEEGNVVWTGDDWVAPSKAKMTQAGPAVDPILVRYRAAFKLIAAGSRRSEKGKDVLGSASPWKLNLYDDDKDGTWDRAKLDTNRDEVDDEKWNHKNGQWEKEGGAKIWSGTSWIEN